MGKHARRPGLGFLLVVLIGACAHTGASPADSTRGTAGAEGTAPRPAPVASDDRAPAAAGAAAKPDEAASPSVTPAGGNGAAGGTGEAGPATPSQAPTLAAAMKDYKTWTRRTPEPVPISVQIFSLCRAPTLAEEAFVDSEHGDVDLALLDWVNDAALRGVRESSSSFPVGAAIVKEKLKSGAGGRELAALGIMIKREPGFDAARGDWQFGYWEPKSGLLTASADIEACATCHARSATDYVFVDGRWRQGQP